VVIVDKKGMVVLDKNVQLELLNEVVEKHTGDRKPVKIDLSNDVRRFNFWGLGTKQCFVFCNNTPLYKREFIEDATRTSFLVQGLSEFGHEYRLKLVEELEVIELRRQSVKAFEEGNQKAEEANKIARGAKCWSVIAVVIAAVLPFILRASGCAP
jgi:hypothetical protein